VYRFRSILRDESNGACRRLFGPRWDAPYARINADPPLEQGTLFCNLSQPAQLAMRNLCGDKLVAAGYPQ